MVDLSVYTNHRMGDMYYNTMGRAGQESSPHPTHCIFLQLANVLLASIRVPTLSAGIRSEVCESGTHT